MAQVKTVTTTSGENTITFDSFYPFVWIRNTGENDITAANYSGAQAGDENTVSIKAGEIAMIQAETASVYIIGATTVELHAQGFAECPFKRVAKGGEQISVESLSVTQNGTYTAEQGKAYSPVTVDVQEQPWEPLQDGYSNFWFELTDDTLSPWLNFSAKNADAVIDWGDGTGEQSLDTLTPTHTYSKAGKYVVKVKGVTGLARLHSVLDSKYFPTLKSIELNNDVLAFADTNSFRYCSALTNVAMSNTITSLGLYTFQFDTCIETINISTGASTIGSYFLYYSYSLKKITIPANIATISNSAFFGCTSLSEIHVQATTPPTLGTNVFGSIYPDYIIYVPIGTGDTYKSAAGWSAYSDHILEEGEVVTRAMQRKFAREAKALEEDTGDMR